MGCGKLASMCYKLHVIYDGFPLLCHHDVSGEAGRHLCFQVVDMPLLIEVGAHHFLRPCVVVTCSHETEARLFYQLKAKFFGPAW